jgi:putative hemolysin
MTPRHDMEWLDLEDPPEAIRAQLADGRHARYMLCEGNIDNVLGVVAAEDLLAKALAAAPLDLPRDLRAALRPPRFVPTEMPVFRLLEEFRKGREHVAITLDEFGGVQGLVTLDDILEALVGEYAPRAEGEEPAVVRRDDGSWLVDGTLPVEELEARLDLDPLPVEDHRGFRTVAGFVVARLGRIPRTGDRTDWGGFRFEVVDMDGRRIDKVLVTPQPPAAGPADRARPEE